MVAFDPFDPGQRWGSAPHRFGGPQVARDDEDDAPTLEALPAALAMATHATGVLLTLRDLAGITGGYVLVPLLEEPRPAPRTSRWATACA